MSFTISAIVLYSKDGQTRELRFNRHGLNIITGNSKTGKSAIIDIVDYCLGRGSFNVAEGEIRRKVSWFGLHLSKDKDEVFIARDNPGPGLSNSSQVYFQRGKIERYPSLEKMSKNVTVGSLKKFITQFAGIVENEHRPIKGTRPPLNANIKHSLWLCFQPQGTIATKEQLFHRMNEQYLPQALQDTLPYFLGAVDEKHFTYLAELDELKERLRLLKAQEDKRLQAVELSRNRITHLVNEGKRLGLIAQDYYAIDDSVFDFLARVASTRIDTPTIIQDFGETIQNLRAEQSSIQAKLSELNQDIRAARTFLSVQTEFSREASEQSARLKSIELYKKDDDSQTFCPLCGLESETPLPRVEQIKESLRKVDNLLNEVHRESPHIQKHIAQLSSQIEELTSNLKLVQQELVYAISEDAEAQSVQNQLMSRAKYIGKLTDFLDIVQPGEEVTDAKEQILELNTLIDSVIKKLDSEETVSRMETFLNLIGQRMTEYSRELELEHSGSSLRLDINKLTVVADTEDGPIPLNRMGSGENWVGYHILAHLALHWWFRKRKRPIPAFLILDQPTQAYYPPDRVEGGLDQIEKNADRLAVQALFRLMRSASQEIEKPFQLIVFDHAHLDEDWFEDSIIEEWRGEKALVPRIWPSG